MIDNNWTKKYLFDPIEHYWFNKKTFKLRIRTFFVLLIHALLPHKEPNSSIEPLPKLPQLGDKSYEICNLIYKSSLERIEALEKKAFNLLSYITALFTVLSFAYLQSPPSQFRILFLVPISFLILSIIISFRCLNVKSLLLIFMDDVFSFTENVTESKERLERYLLSLLSSSIFNEAKADNTADMLNVSRYLVFISIILAIIIVPLNFLMTVEPKPKTEELLLIQQTSTLKNLDTTFHELKLNTSSMLKEGKDLRMIEQKLSLLEIKIDSLNKFRQTINHIPQLKK